MNQKVALAVQRSDWTQLQLMVDNGADLNAIDGNGKCAIYIAASCYSVSLIDFLCDNGANINGFNQDGRNALHFASNFGRKYDDCTKLEQQRQCIQLLLERGIDLCAPDKFGRTPLHLLAAAPVSEPLEWLLQKNPDINAQDNYGLSPLCYAVGQRLENTQLLIDRGADVSVVTPSGQRPLTLAAMTGASDIMKLLFENIKATTKATTEPDALGRTPLFYAVMTGYLEPCQTAVNQLTKKNEPPRDIYGTTPAMIAARNGHTEILRLLLSSINCQIDVPDNDELSFYCIGQLEANTRRSGLYSILIWARI